MNLLSKIPTYEAYHLLHRFPALSNLYQKMGSSDIFRPIIWRIKELDNKRYRRKRTKFYSKFIRPGDWVFDVGANIGNRSDIFLNLGAHVIAIEPQPHCMSYLRKKYRGKPRIKLVEQAVGKKMGKATLFISGSDANSSLSSEWIQDMSKSKKIGNVRWNNQIEVQITTLDQLIKTYGKPIFCKIDVEGYELEVLQGLSQPIKYVSFEFFPERVKTLISCLDTLSKLGKYTFNYALGEEARLKDKWLSKDALLQAVRALPLSAQGDIYCCRAEKIRS